MTATFPPASDSVTSIDTSPALIAALRAGSSGALASAYRVYAPLVYRTAMRLCGSRTDAEDTVQEVFLALPETVRSYAGRGRFDAWLRTLAARQALMHLRRGRRRAEDVLADEHPASGDGGRPAHAAIDLASALAHLPDALRLVVVLKEMEGYSHEEIGRLLGISSGASRVRLSRALRLLRDHLRS